MNILLQSSLEDQQKAKAFWTEKSALILSGKRRWALLAIGLRSLPKDGERSGDLSKSMMKNWEEQKAAIVFTCDDIQATYDQMKANGVQFEGELQKNAMGNLRYIQG